MHWKKGKTYWPGLGSHALGLLLCPSSLWRQLLPSCSVFQKPLALDCWRRPEFAWPRTKTHYGSLKILRIGTTVHGKLWKEVLREKTSNKTEALFCHIDRPKSFQERQAWVKDCINATHRHRQLNIGTLAVHQQVHIFSAHTCGLSKSPRCKKNSPDLCWFVPVSSVLAKHCTFWLIHEENNMAPKNKDGTWQLQWTKVVKQPRSNVRTNVRPKC